MNCAAMSPLPPSRPTALIAEDEPLLAAHLRHELASAWPELEVLAVCGNGPLALERALALRPQVCFLDIRMPGMTGLEVAEALAEDWPQEHGVRDSDIDMLLDLRVHVTPLNVDMLEEFTDYLVETFLPDDRFNAYFFPIVDLGGPQQGNFRVLRKEDAARVVSRLTGRVRDALATMAPRRSLRRARVEVKAGCESPYVCYAAKPNAWVIRSNGTLSKCTVGFEDPRNDVGRVSRDGSFDLRTDRLQPWMRGWTTGDQLSLHCPYEGMRDDVRAGLVESRA